MSKFGVFIIVFFLPINNFVFSQQQTWESIYISKNGENKLQMKDAIDFQELPLTLVFFADWCYPCRKIIDKPILENISKITDKLYFISADNDLSDLQKNLKDKKEYEHYYKTKNSNILYGGYKLMMHIINKAEFPFIAVIQKDGKIDYIEKIGELKKAGKLIEEIQNLTKKTKKESISDSNEIIFNNIKLNVVLYDINNNTEYIDSNVNTLENFIGVKYELIVPNNIGVRNFSFLDNFDYELFEFGEDKIEGYEVNSIKYKKQNLSIITIKKGVLSSKKRGLLELEPIKIKLHITIPTDKKDVFEKIIYKEKTVYTSSQSLKIKWQ